MTDLGSDVVVQVLRATLVVAKIAATAAIAMAQTEPVRQPPPGYQQNVPRQLERNPNFEDPRLELGSKSPVYQMMWRKRDAGEVIRDVAAAATIMLGGAEAEGLEAR